MDKKIKVTICSGTACFVMGSSDILLLEEKLPEHLKNIVEIDGATCLGYCKDLSNGKAPFVVINGEIISAATLPMVLNKIEEIANA